MDSSAKKDAIGHSWRIEEWFPGLGKDSLEKLRLFHEELQRFNRTLSLVSSGTTDKIDLVHVSDSILGWNVMKKNFQGKELYDVGSGNGFPGIIIGILQPTLNLVLVESDIRKAEYLKHTADLLGLKNVKVRNLRLEAMENASISNAVLRGFANIPKALLAFRKVMAQKGQIYHFKGPEWSTELAALPQQLCSTWNNSHLGDYTLPGGQVTHAIVCSQLI